MDVKEIMISFIHSFMEEEGVPVQRTSEECMQYLQAMGCGYYQAMQILSMAVRLGFIHRTSDVNGVITYN